MLLSNSSSSNYTCLNEFKVGREIDKGGITLTIDAEYLFKVTTGVCYYLLIRIGLIVVLTWAIVCAFLFLVTILDAYYF